MRRADPAATSVGTALAAVVAVACCAGLPALAALAGGVTIGVVVGAGGGLLAISALVGRATLVIRARRSRRPRTSP